MKKQNLHPINISLAEVVIEEKELTKAQLGKLSDALQVVGFESIDDRRSKLIEQIKTFVIERIHYSEKQPKKITVNYYCNIFNMITLI